MRKRLVEVTLALAAASLPCHAQTSVPSPDVRRLGEMASRRDVTDAQAADAVRDGLKSADPKVRGQALGVLVARLMTSGMAGRGQAASVLLDFRASVIAMVGDPDAGVRMLVPSALGALDGFREVFGAPTPRLLAEDARKVLDARFAQEPSAQVRAAIVQALGSGPGGPPNAWRGDEATIVTALQDPSEWVRATAARTAGNRQIASAVPALVKMLSDPAVEPRLQAAAALQHLPGVRPYLAELEAALARETVSSVKGALAAAIARLRGTAAIDRPQLVAASRPEVSDADAAPVLRVGLQSDDGDIRRAAVNIINGRIRTSASRRQVVADVLLEMRAQVFAMAADPDGSVRESVPPAVLTFDRYSAAGALSLRSPLRDDARELFAARFEVEVSDVVRASLVRTLAYGPSAPGGEARGRDLDAIASALRDPSPLVRAAAAGSAGQRALLSALPRLVQLLSDVEVEPRLKAAQVIGDFGAQARSYLPQVDAALRAETNVAVRAKLAETIERIR